MQASQVAGQPPNHIWLKSVQNARCHTRPSFINNVQQCLTQSCNACALSCSQHLETITPLPLSFSRPVSLPPAAAPPTNSAPVHSETLLVFAPDLTLAACDMQHLAETVQAQSPDVRLWVACMDMTPVTRGAASHSKEKHPGMTQQQVQCSS